MPRELKNPVVQYVRPLCVQERPECARLIGTIAAEWSNIETQIAYYFAYLIFGFRDETTQRRDGGELIAIDIMENTLAFQAKCNMLLNAAQARFGDDDKGCKELEKELQQLQRRCRRRNEVVHGRWALCDEEPNSLVWRGRISRPSVLVYDVRDFEEILQQIIDAQASLNTCLIAEFDPRLKFLPLPKMWHVLSKE